MLVSPFSRSVLILTALIGAVPLACGDGAQVSRRRDGTGGSSGSGATGGTSATGGTGATGGTSVIGTGGQGADAGAGPVDDPCDVANPPPECFELQPSGPACGDGKINQDSEACDDGNSLPGDGCSGVCVKEPFFECETEGEPCTSTIACGDGTRDPGEVCDDGNDDDDDGCSADCLVLDASYVCPTPGEDCILLFECGDGRVNGSETCDDGNPDSDDGCSSSCKVEDGYSCSKPGKKCTKLIVCQDGVLEGTEQCDDGNDDAADGCSPQCRIEADFECSDEAGQKSTCTSTVKCNDGIVSGGEACDDGNNDDGDGCAGDCSAITDGYECPRPGHACKTICGDGKKLGGEQCDDGGTGDGDGCSANCRIEDNTVCTGGSGEESDCHAAVCGANGKEGTEPCDDGNDDWGDGCTPSCQKEPTCGIGEACSSACGDGIKFPAEACDDGNNTNGDGCSASCAIEPGFSCTTAGGSPDLLDLPMVVRDFKPSAPFTVTDDTGITSGHGDFQWGGYGHDDPNASKADNWSNYPTLPGTGDAFTGGRNGSILAQGVTLGGGGGMEYGFVANTLGSDKKPVFAFEDDDVNTATCPLVFGSLIRDSNAYCVRQVQNATSFARWYHDDDAYNNTYAQTLPLHRCLGTEPANDACTGMAAGTYVYDSKYTRVDNVQYPAGIGYKGFWPVDSAPNVAKFDQCGLSCPNGNGDCPTGTTCNAGTCTEKPCATDGDCPYASTCNTGSGTCRRPKHNYHFTSEVHHWFQFDSAAPPTLIFTGDDDVFVFIAGKLVLDLGGTHGAQQGIVALDAGGDANFTRPAPNATGTVDLNLVNNSIYEIVVFQAERNTCESNYRLSLQNFNLRRSTCTPICGVNPDDTVTLTPPEECDDGANNTPTPEYGKCTADSCTLGPYCGDGHPDPDEECDDGVNRAVWGQSGCAPGCVNAPACGDGTIDTQFEECDLGDDNTSDGYGGCTDECEIGPSCGDGNENGDETCDDGVNDGRYGSCMPNCTPGPRCGDNVKQEEWGEECDDDDDDNCANCRLGAQCGDKVKQSGEDCDDGVNDGGYGECGPQCKQGPRCGDGVVAADFEDCDDGDDGNTGGYGKCAPGCVYGPHCGDGKINKPYEQCDDKNNRNGDGCSSACKKETQVPR